MDDGPARRSGGDDWAERLRHAAASVGGVGLEELERHPARSIEWGVVAPIALRNGAVLATRNIKDFDYLGINCVSPFEARG